MSADATAWVWRYSPADTPTRLKVHLAIADSVSDLHDNEFFMGTSKLARKARCSRSSAIEAEQWLGGHLQDCPPGCDQHADVMLLEVLEPPTDTTAGRYRFLTPEGLDVVFEAKRRPRRRDRQPVQPPNTPTTGDLFGDGTPTPATVRDDATPADDGGVRSPVTLSGDRAQVRDDATGVFGDRAQVRDHRTEIQNPTDPNLDPNGETCAAEPRASASIEAEFEAWWDGYPRKRSKSVAFTAYEHRRREGWTVEALIAARDRFVASVRRAGTELQFVPYPAKFLLEQLDDDLSSETRTAAPSSSTGPWVCLAGNQACERGNVVDEVTDLAYRCVCVGGDVAGPIVDLADYEEPAREAS